MCLLLESSVRNGGRLTDALSGAALQPMPYLMIVIFFVSANEPVTNL